MTGPPTPAEKFEHAVEEGGRRLDQSLVELVSTSVIAGFTIVFGVIALGVVDGLARPVFGEFAAIVGALAFGPGVVFLVLGRAELFTENFFDPAAAVIDRSNAGALLALGRLWAGTYVFNLVGGGLFALPFAVSGVLPVGATEVLVHVAAESASRTEAAWFASGVAGGAFVALLSYLIAGTDSSGTRFGLAYVVGVLLALEPFDHVIVTALHTLVGILLGAEVGVGRVALLLAVVTAGNFVGGLGLVTLTHITQTWGAQSE